MMELDDAVLGFCPAKRFERIAQAQPEAPALAQGGNEWTYKEVLEACKRYVHILSEQKTGDEVAIVFGHNAQAIIAFMGSIMAGVLCVPIDPMAPPQGVEKIFARCKLILTEDEFLPWCEAKCGGTPILDGPLETLTVSSTIDGPPLVESAPDTAHIVYFSSGSQGVPKGTLRTQHQIKRSIIRLRTTLGYGPTDRQALFASFAFAGAAPVVLGGLLTGGAIDIIDLRNKNTVDFARLIDERGLTILTATPSLLRALIDGLAGKRTTWQPRILSVGGERLLTQDIVNIREKLDWTSRIIHRLAASEVGIIAQWDVDLDLCDPNGVVPVGYPSKGLNVTFQDEEGHDLPTGHIGELVVSGENLAGGYWNLPELTKERFSDISNEDTSSFVRYLSGDLGCLNAHGLVEFMGRKDSAVKIRGYSIDKDAVEAALCQLNGVVNAIVVVSTGQSGNDFLLGYVQKSKYATLNAVELRKALFDELPPFMVPRRILILDALPLTSGGKIDHRNLPSLTRDRHSGMERVVPPVGDTETALAKIWSDVLEIDDISRADDFFEIGGDSLDAISVLMKLHDVMGIKIEETELFKNTKLSDMAGFLSRL